MKHETARARLQAQVQDVWPGAVVELTEYNEYVVRRGITAGKWRGWPTWCTGLVLGSQYAAAKAAIAQERKERKWHEGG